MESRRDNFLPPVPLRAVSIDYRIEYRLTRDDNPLAEGYTVHACLSSASRPVRLPEELKRPARDSE